MRGRHFAAEFKKTNKIDYQKTESKTWNRKTEEFGLDKSSEPAPLASASTKGEKGAKSMKRGIFEGTEGGFMRVCSMQNGKCIVFQRF